MSSRARFTRAIRPQWLLLGALAACVPLALWVRRSLGVTLEPAALLALVEKTGIWGPLVFVALVAFRTPLGLPSQLVLILGGLCFGTFAGTAYGACGITLSAIFAFLVGRYTGRHTIVRRTPRRLRPLLDLAGSRMGAVFVGAGTAYPIGPIIAYHTFAGVTSMPLYIFACAIVPGAAIRAAIYTFFGSSLSSGSTDRILQASLLIGLSLLLPLLLPTTRRWLRQIFLPPKK